MSRGIPKVWCWRVTNMRTGEVRFIEHALPKFVRIDARKQFGWWVDPIHVQRKLRRYGHSEHWKGCGYYREVSV